MNECYYGTAGFKRGNKEEPAEEADVRRLVESKGQKLIEFDEDIGGCSGVLIELDAITTEQLEQDGELRWTEGYLTIQISLD